MTRNQNLVAFALVALAGCATDHPMIRRASAAPVHCKDNQLTIQKVSTSATYASTWDAVCFGQRYECAGTVTPDTYQDVACTRQVPPPALTPTEGLEGPAPPPIPPNPMPTPLLPAPFMK